MKIKLTSVLFIIALMIAGIFASNESFAANTDCNTAMATSGSIYKFFYEIKRPNSNFKVIYSNLVDDLQIIALNHKCRSLSHNKCNDVILKYLDEFITRLSHPSSTEEKMKTDVLTIKIQMNGIQRAVCNTR